MSVADVDYLLVSFQDVFLEINFSPTKIQAVPQFCIVSRFTCHDLLATSPTLDTQRVFL